MRPIATDTSGFRFATEDETTVYNPVSVAWTLAKKEKGFKCIWSTTGRPSMLMNYLKREEVLRINPDRIGGISESEFDVAELRNLSPVALLFQAGYLTIKDYNPVTWSYTLGVPDEEVRRDLCTMMTGVAANTFDSNTRHLVDFAAEQCRQGQYPVVARADIKPPESRPKSCAESHGNRPSLQHQLPLQPGISSGPMSFLSRKMGK